jgi:hypothetical protein
MRTGEDLQGMEDVIRFDRLLNELWNVYWIKQDAKRTNAMFMDIFNQMNVYVALVTDVSGRELIPTSIIWDSITSSHSIIGGKTIIRLGRKSSKMTPEERATTSRIHKEILVIYQKYNKQE